VNLAWATTMPTAALVAYPVLRLGGPIVAYNLLMLAAPALAAYAAYRLCRYVTASLAPALVGGYVFGFSTYMLGHLLGHLNLVLVALMPVAVLLALEHLDGRLSRRALVVWLAPLLVLQFGLSTELFVTLAAFAAFALAVAYLVSEAAGRRALRRLVSPVSRSPSRWSSSPRTSPTRSSIVPRSRSPRERRTRSTSRTWSSQRRSRGCGS
jgi:hypothetical protein